MADMGVNTQWLASPDARVEEMWIDVQIQERRSRIVKMNQDIEDLMKVQKIKLDAQVMMLEKEIGYLLEKKKTVGIEDAIIN